MPVADDPSGEVTELLQQLIRNACVNHQTEDSGQEVRSADVLAGYLTHPGVDHQRFSPLPGRTSLLTRIEGSDPSAPTLMLMGHTDVVPANPAGWSRDPYGGELVDGEVWGRGAVDMLNLTASMAVAVRRLADSGWRPRGTLLYLAVADEEALGTHGAQWLVEHEADAVRADYVVTENGGLPARTPDGRLVLNVNVAEKGPYWCRLTVHGTPGHGSMPYGTDNALVTAAEVVRRVAAFHAPHRLDDVWARTVSATGLPDDVVALLTDPDRVDAALAGLPPNAARFLHACSHTTFSPNVAHGGGKINVIPDEVDLDVDIRALAGDDAAALLDQALGDLRDRVTVQFQVRQPGSSSPADTPMWEAMTRAARRHHPGATLVPTLLTGATDARFFRAAGAVAYGFGLFSHRISRDQFASMFHGNDERVDVESLRLSTLMWEELARDLLG